MGELSDRRRCRHAKHIGEIGGLREIQGLCGAVLGAFQRCLRTGLGKEWCRAGVAGGDLVHMGGVLENLGMDAMAPSGDGDKRYPQSSRIGQGVGAEEVREVAW